MTTTLTRQHSTTRLAAALTVAAFLTACGGGGSSSNTTVTTTTTTTLPNTIVGSVSPANYAANTPQRDAYDYLNSQRQLCGFGLLQQDVKLDLAAQGHANYLATNNLIGHNQNQAQWPSGFTGASISDRFAAAGYLFTNGGEVATAGSSTPSVASTRGQESIMNWFAAPYHGYYTLLGFRDIGIGYATAAQDRVVIDFGSTGARPTQFLGGADVVTYPCNGASGVLAQSYVAESPTPIPNRNIAAASAPIGSPIYIKVRDGQKLTLTSTDLRAVGTNTSLTLIALTKANDVNTIILDESIVMLMPNVPLAKNTSYLFTATGTNNGAPITVSFTFSTGAY